MTDPTTDDVTARLRALTEKPLLHMTAFDVTLGRRTDLVPLEVLTDAPEAEHLTMPMGELNAGEPF